MDATLSDLDKKITQLIDQVQLLRSENQSLRQQLAVKADESTRLSKKVAAASDRLNALLKRLPEPAE